MPSPNFSAGDIGTVYEPLCDLYDSLPPNVYPSDVDEENPRVLSVVDALIGLHNEKGYTVGELAKLALQAYDERTQMRRDIEQGIEGLK